MTPPSEDQPGAAPAARPGAVPAKAKPKKPVVAGEPAKKAAPTAQKPTAPVKKTAVSAKKPAPRAKKPVPAPLPRARIRTRHRGAMAGFALCVLVPFLLAAAYLWAWAADQYHSDVAFSIRSEEAGAASTGLLGTLSQMGGGTASDADILFEFIRSAEIVREIDAELDLRAIYNRATGDPVFTLGDDPSIEALLDHWERMVDVSLNSNIGIIQIRALAFSPEEAQAIATAILKHSGALVNRLSDQAREDAVRFSREELAEAEEVLRKHRQDLVDFRKTYNIVDPTADVAGQAGLLSALQGELAQALVSRDVLLSYASAEDQRVVQANRRITAITERIEEERSSLDLTGLPGSLPDVVGRYEELLVNLEFANTAFTQTLAGLSASRAEARRQSRYLAAHIQPTLAESPLYPRRLTLAGLAGLFLMLGWSILMLVWYNIRDNR